MVWHMMYNKLASEQYRLARDFTLLAMSAIRPQTKLTYELMATQCQSDAANHAWKARIATGVE